MYLTPLLVQCISCLFTDVAFEASQDLLCFVGNSSLLGASRDSSAAMLDPVSITFDDLIS